MLLSSLGLLGGSFRAIFRSPVVLQCEEHHQAAAVDAADAGVHAAEPVGHPVLICARLRSLVRHHHAAPLLRRAHLLVTGYQG